MPKAWPKLVSASTSDRSRPPTSAPMRAAVENSDAVLPPMDSRYSASVRAALYVLRS